MSKFNKSTTGKCCKKGYISRSRSLSLSLTLCLSLSLSLTLTLSFSLSLSLSLALSLRSHTTSCAHPMIKHRCAFQRTGRCRRHIVRRLVQLILAPCLPQTQSFLGSHRAPGHPSDISLPDMSPYEYFCRMFIVSAVSCVSIHQNSYSTHGGSTWRSRAQPQSKGVVPGAQPYCNIQQRVSPTCFSVSSLALRDRL